jgi:predicted RNase H-like HicB family nuclease
MKVTYPAVFYYEKHKYKDEESVLVRFPDLKAIGLPAGTCGTDFEDAKEAAEEVLEYMIELAKERGIELPPASPLEKVNLDRGFDSEDVGEPFRIEIVNIAIEVVEE